MPRTPLQDSWEFGTLAGHGHGRTRAKRTPFNALIEDKEQFVVILFRRLAQPLVAGTICGTFILLLLLLCWALQILDPGRYGSTWLLSGSLSTLPFLLAEHFLPRSFLHDAYLFSNFLLPFAFWFVIGFVARLVSHGSRATLFICIGLFVLNVISGLVIFFMFWGVGP